MLLGPTSDPDPARSGLLSRVASLEARVQAIDPRPLIVEPLAAVGTTMAIPVTAGAYTAIWRAYSPRLSHPALYVRVPYVNEAATSGSMRVVIAGPGSATSTVQALALGASGYYVLGWQHLIDTWTPGEVSITVEAYRTGGAGNVFIFQPQIGLIDPRGCTAGGGTWYATSWMPSWTP